MATASDEDFNEELSFLGKEVDDPDIFDKLRDLCRQHRMEASDIVCSWIASIKTQKQSKLTLESLDQLEKDLQSKGNKHNLKTPSRGADKQGGYGLQQMEESDALMDTIAGYSTPANKNLAKKRQHTPENTYSNKRVSGLAGGYSPAAPFSPASFSPASGTPGKKYGSRTNSGEVVLTHGNVNAVRWTSTRSQGCSIKPYPSDPDTELSSQFKYMFQKLTEKALVLNDHIEGMAEFLKEHFKFEGYAHLALPAQEEVTVVGRVCCDSNGKLNAQSVVLEGSREISGGRQIPVDLTQVSHYSLFPGQIVAMQGINSTGNKFVAKKVYENVPLALPEEKPALRDGPLHVVVAAGPFTTSDSTSYEPLKDLLQFLKKTTPDVCILLGPFLDSKNAELDNLLNEPYDSNFKKTQDYLINETKKLRTEIVLIPSHRDIHHSPVYPQPPFVFSNGKPSKMSSMSDPCTLLIDGVAFGITSTDILFHLGAEEISSPPGGSDRLSRLAQHIITQHNYYPLYPPSEEVNIDYEHWEKHCRMPVMTHIMLVPSDLRYFVKDVCGCCCVNPGRLTKGQTGGTFAHLVVQPGNQTLSERISAKVIRI